MSADTLAASATSPSIAVRFALRELRGGLRGFYVLIFCIALGVMAIAGVGSFAESLTGGLAREGRAIVAHALEHEAMHSLAGPRVVAAQRLEHDQRAAQPLRVIHRALQREVPAGATEGRHPVEHVMPVCPRRDVAQRAHSHARGLPGRKALVART